LVLRLRAAGCQVLVIGKSTTPLALQQASTAFVSTDQLLSSPVEPSPQSEGLCLMLLNAYEATAERVQKRPGGWIRLSELGTALRQLDPLFRPARYGYKNLLSVLQAFPELFTTRTQASKGHPILLRRTTSDGPD
jgi:hypothetical protein